MNKTMDMTKGNIFKLLILFSLPLFIGNLFQLLYSFCDSVISTHLIGPDALGAIGSTSSVTSLILTMASGMGSGTSIIISKAFGEHNDKRIKNSIFNIVVINIIISIILSIVTLLCTDMILRLLKVPDNIYSMSKEYFVVIIAGLITTLMYNTLSGILRALGNSAFPLYVLIFSCFINIGGDFLFILAFKMGLAGSALSTILSQLIAVIILVIYILKKYPLFRIRKEDMTFNKKNVIDIVSTGLSMGLMNSVFTIGGILMARAVNELGSNIISANSVGRRLIEICMLPLGSLSSAIAVFVSQNYGAKNIDRAKEGIKKANLCSLIWSIFVLVMFIFEKPLAMALAGTKEPEVIDNALMCINYAIPFYSPLGILLNIRMSLQSFGRKLIPLFSSCIELIFKVISAFVWIPKFGYFGEVITEPISWVICFLFVTIIFLWYSRKEIFTQKKKDLSIN